MKIINKTNLNTKLLGAFIRRVAEFEELTPEDINQLNVRVVYRRRSHNWRDTATTGYAWYNTWSMVLKVVKGVMPEKPDMAHTIAHELAHCQGLHHGKTMKNKMYGWHKDTAEYWKWAEELPLALNAPEEKPKLAKDALVLKKLEHCQAAVTEWERKARLAKTKQRKWQQKVKYYERQLQKAAAQAPVHAEAVAIVEKIMDNVPVIVK